MMLEGTYTPLNEGAELDLKHEKWCTCTNPSGFRFITSEGNEQIWRHITCGGLVLKPMHSTNKTYGKDGGSLTIR
jgi:hypothetical protein